MNNRHALLLFILRGNNYAWVHHMDQLDLHRDLGKGNKKRTEKKKKPRYRSSEPAAAQQSLASPWGRDSDLSRPTAPSLGRVFLWVEKFSPSM